MTERYLTITLQPDWKGALRAVGQAAAKADTYQGEVLNFESPGHFFGQLSEKLWEIVSAAQGKGELSVRALARAVGRDVKRVHQDVVVLACLGLLERTEGGGVVCPYSSMQATQENARKLNANSKSDLCFYGEPTYTACAQSSEADTTVYPRAS